MLRAVRGVLVTSAGAVRGFAITGRASKNVANKKNKQDAAKSKLFTRLGVRILMAARAGGPDATKNAELARALKEAVQVKLPKDNVERALKKAGEKDTSDFSKGLYEIQGHGGAALVVQTLTNNPTRAVKEIKEQARRSVGAKFTTGGSVLFNFAQRAVLRAAAPYSEEAVVEAAIEAEVDDVDFGEDPAAAAADADAPLPPIIVTEPEALSRLQEALGKAGIATRGDLEYLPTGLVELSEEDADKNDRLIDALEALDDVDHVFHNME